MEKINIAELLKDCPEGMELDCTIWDNVTLVNVSNGDITFPITLSKKNDDSESYFVTTKYGQYFSDSKCVIFPKGKTTWEGFVPPCNFKDGDIIVDTFGGIHIMQNSTTSYCYFDRLGILDKTKTTCVRVERPASEEEKKKLFDAIKENGYKWNEKTKTLYKWVEPKFKVGDRIKSKGINLGIVTITKVCEYHYELDDGCTLKINGQDYYELVLNKFDINTLIPFESKVLIRDNESQKWYPAIWGVYDPETYFPYKLIGCISNCCIPYEGNEHLLGTSDDCDNFYKVWKE